MERSFSRGDHPMIPQRGQFAGESSSASSHLQDPIARRRYIDGEVRRAETQRAEQERGVRESRDRFSKVMSDSDLLPFYGDPEFSPKKALEMQDERRNDRAERIIKDSMNKELDELEEVLTRLRNDPRRKRKHTTNYTAGWRDQEDSSMFLPIIDRFHPRTDDERRLRDAERAYAEWRLDGFQGAHIPASQDRTRRHLPTTKPIRKDIERNYSLRPSWDRDFTDEQLNQDIDEELEALLDERRRRRE